MKLPGLRGSHGRSASVQDLIDALPDGITLSEPKTETEDLESSIKKTMNEKEEAIRNWEKCEYEFFLNTYQLNLSLISMEETEKECREAELYYRMEALENKRQEHNAIENEFENDLGIMREYLEDLEADHKAEEECLAREIADFQDRLAHLKVSVKHREKSIQALDAPKPIVQPLYPDLSSMVEELEKQNSREA